MFQGRQFQNGKAVNHILIFNVWFLLSDFFGLTLDELVKDIDIQEVREKNLNSERLNSIYSDVENAKKIIKWGAIIGGSICFILLIFVICLIFIFVY